MSDDQERVLQARNTITPLEFLEAVYTNEELELAVRMRAAIAAAQYRHPKLAVSANLTRLDMGARLDTAWGRSRAAMQGLEASEIMALYPASSEAKLIEGRVTDGHLIEEGAEPEKRRA